MITIPKARLAGMDMETIKKEQLKEALIKKTEEKEDFKIPGIVIFLLCLIVAYYGMSLYYEIYHDNAYLTEIRWDDYPDFGIFYPNDVVRTIMALDALSLISVGLLLLRKKIGYTMLIVFSALAVFAMGVLAQKWGLSSIGNTIMYRALWMPFVVYAILQIKGNNGGNLWQNLR